MAVPCGDGGSLMAALRRGSTTLWTNYRANDREGAQAGITKEGFMNGQVQLPFTINIYANPMGGRIKGSQCSKLGTRSKRNQRGENANTDG